MVTIESLNYTALIKNDLLTDWENLTHSKDIFLEKEYERLKRVYKDHAFMSEDIIRGMATKKTRSLNDEVIQWLNENVKPSSDKAMKDQPQGWAMGNDHYRATDDHNRLSIWFLRRRDAMAFIKRWSVHKKPTTFFNYFTEERKELFEGKLVKIKQF